MPAVPIGAWVANRYRVEAFLGDGTYGEVYRVWDDHQSQMVALKALDPKKVAAWPWREATQLTRLRSDFILSIWNADVVTGVPFIVTEVADHGTVGDLVRAGPLMPGEAVQRIRHAARGTARAHDDGVVHRDIKLDNLFVGADGRTMLGDFGLAHPLDPSSGLAPGTGTPITCAPEVLAGGPTSRASDVYSLGASLYACLVGEYPYQREAKLDVGMLRSLVAAGPPTPIRDAMPTVSRLLARVVADALARNPGDRPTAAELDGELGRISFDRDWIPRMHSGHDSCWESPRGPSLHVCMSTVGRRLRIDVTYQPSNRHLRDLCGEVRPSQAAARLRRIFEQLGN